MRATLDYAHTRIERALRIGVVQVKSGQRRPTIKARGPQRPDERRNRPITAEERAAIVAMWNTGAKVGPIFRNFQRDRGQIVAVLKAAGINASTRARVPKREAIIVDLLSGKSVREIAAKRKTGNGYIRLVESDLIAEGKLANHPQAKRTEHHRRKIE